VSWNLGMEYCNNSKPVGIRIKLTHVEKNYTHIRKQAMMRVMIFKEIKSRFFTSSF